MNIIETEVKGVYIIEPKVFGDERGWFMESYSKRTLPMLPESFVQDNHSYSAQKGIIRGIHFQQEPYAQAKLVRCTRGAVKDFAVDLRKQSPTYLRWVGAELTEENKRMLFLPKGFGHGFVTLTDDVEFQYKADQYYNAESDRSIRFDDPEIGIEWGVAEPILSQKDRSAPLLCDSDCNFRWDKLR